MLSRCFSLLELGSKRQGTEGKRELRECMGLGTENLEGDHPEGRYPVGAPESPGLETDLKPSLLTRLPPIGCVLGPMLGTLDLHHLHQALENDGLPPGIFLNG